MYKNVFVLIIAGLPCIAWASINSIAKVDAVTKATLHNNMKIILPIAVTHNSATITWTQIKRKNEGNGMISYGNSTSTKVSRTVTETERVDQHLVLTGLPSNETNTIWLEFTDPDNFTHIPFADTATITTNPGTFTITKFVTKKDMPLELLDHSIHLGSIARISDHIIIVNMRGQTLLSRLVTRNKMVIGLPSSIKGVVLLMCVRKGNMVAKKKIIITY